MKATVFVVIAAAMSVSLLSCGSAHEAEENYYLISANIQVPYWKTAGAGFMDAARDMKVPAHFEGPDSYDPKAEQQVLQQAIAKKPTGILISVTDPALLKADIDNAISAGIPVITIDSDAPESKRLFFIGTDNYQAGRIGGQRLAKDLNGKGNVAVFTIPEMANMKDRLRGYRDALEPTPGIKISRIIDIKGDPRIAFDNATQIIGNDKKEKIDAFVCLEALSGKEVATVISNNKMKGKTIIAMDTDPDTLDWINKGVISATITQKPYTMAHFGVALLDALYHHKPGKLDSDWARDSLSPMPAFVDTGSALVDKSNVDAFIAANKSVTSGQR